MEVLKASMMDGVRGLELDGLELFWSLFFEVWSLIEGGPSSLALLTPAG